MTQVVKLKKIGGSLGAILPKDVLQRQNFEAGTELFVTETEDGILLSIADPETKAAMAAFAEGLRENHVALAALAKL